MMNATATAKPALNIKQLRAITARTRTVVKSMLHTLYTTVWLNAGATAIALKVCVASIASARTVITASVMNAETTTWSPANNARRIQTVWTTTAAILNASASQTAQATAQTKAQMDTPRLLESHLKPTAETR